MKDLTIIIPFKNEGIQVYKTIASLYKYCGNDYNVLLINDCSDDGYDYSVITDDFPDVQYLENDTRSGVAGGRDKGASLATTKYILLLDGHMRVFEDILTPMLTYMESHERTLVCLQSKIISQDAEGGLRIQSGQPVSRGCRIDFSMSRANGFLATRWEYLSQPDYLLNEIQIPVVMGAAYCIERDYYLRLHGLNGLIKWGCDEQFLSSKVWLEGGKCVLLRNLEIAHIYRKKAPYEPDPVAAAYNRIIYARLLMGEYARNAEINALTTLCSGSREHVLLNLKEIESEIESERAYLQSIITRSFDDIINLNKDNGNRIYPQ